VLQFYSSNSEKTFGKVVGISMDVEGMTGNKPMTILRRWTKGLQSPRNKL
jgi:hypothetical protein